MEKLRVQSAALRKRGCNAKLRLRDLRSLKQKVMRGAQFYTDSEPLLCDSSIYSSIDTIFAPVAEAVDFGYVATIHAANDLLAKGIVPCDFNAAFSFEEGSFTQDLARETLRGVARAVGEFNGRLGKCHTLIGADTTITMNVCGSAERVQRTLVAGQMYSLVLTKPIGATLGYFLGELLGKDSVRIQSHLILMMSHIRLAKALASICMEGTTDVSGFGLVGHVACFAREARAKVIIRSASIPVIAGLSELISRSGADFCSANRNIEDTEGTCLLRRSLQFAEKVLLYSAETSGPLLSIVRVEDEGRYIKHARSAGFRDAAAIGSIELAKKGAVVIE